MLVSWMLVRRACLPIPRDWLDGYWSWFPFQVYWLLPPRAFRQMRRGERVLTVISAVCGIVMALGFAKVIATFAHG